MEGCAGFKGPSHGGAVCAERAREAATGGLSTFGDTLLVPAKSLLF